MSGYSPLGRWTLEGRAANCNYVTFQMGCLGSQGGWAGLGHTHSQAEPSL